MPTRRIYGSCGDTDCLCLPLHDQDGYQLRSYNVASLRYTKTYTAKNEADARAQHIEGFPRAKIQSVTRVRPGNGYTPRLTESEQASARQSVGRSYRETARNAEQIPAGDQVTVQGTRYSYTLSTTNVSEWFGRISDIG